MSKYDKIYAESIAKEYAPKEASKVNQLRKLDQKVKNPPMIFALAFGIISALIFGTGMCFSLGQFGDTTTNLIIGIAVGIIGIFLCIINYPIYSKLLNSRKKKYAFEIVELAKEIAKENEEE